MSYFKEKHKEYLVKNGIKSEDDLAIYLDILRNSRNSPKEDRQMLMDFAWLLINDKTSISSFFAENKNIEDCDKAFEELFKPTPSKRFYDTFVKFDSAEKEVKNNLEKEEQRIRGNFYRYLDDNTPNVVIAEFNSLENAKMFFKNSPTLTESFYYIYGTNELIEKEEKNSNSPTFMDEVLEQANKEKWAEVNKKESEEINKNIIHHFISQKEIEQYMKTDEIAQFNSTLHKSKEGETHTEVPTFKTIEYSSWKGNPATMEEMFLKVGKKEKEGKLHYELSWEFIEEMAKRMANNKSDKYPLYNWKKDIDVQDLKDAINRHHIEVMKGNYQDGDEILGHIVQYACNSMMLWEQLRNKVK